MKDGLPENSFISHYRIVNKIGEGGMGEVYRAQDPNLGRDVAIKVLPAAFSTDEDRLRRFELEARSAGSLNHPNILVIYHIGTHEGAPFIVSELLEGETLREKMAGGALPQRKALDYALQIAHGLAAAHEKGIIHRDLKPENIFVTTDGRIKILDFGLAKLTHSQGDVANTDLPTRKLQTDPGTVMGTITYMSPEQVRARPLDQRTDIFSFGVIFYEMLTGRVAFHGDSTADLMSAILREEPPRLSTTNSNVPPALERVIDHCLEKSPDERFRSASDLAFAIEALSITSTSISGPAAEGGADFYTKRDRWSAVLPWALAGLLLAVSGTLAYFLWNRPQAELRPTRFTIGAPVNAVEMLEPAVSADGRNIAFVASVEGKQHLFVRSLENLTPQLLAGSENASHPFWSPDGRYIAFFADSKLKKIDPAGGPVQTICDARQGNGGDWNADNTIIFGMFDKGIHRVPAAGGQPSLVVEVDTGGKEVDHAAPAFLPDGNHFFYLSWRGTPELAEVWVASLDGSDRKSIMVNNSNAAYSAGHLLFARSTTLMAQPFDLASLTLSGEAIPVNEDVMFSVSESYSNFSVSRTGVLVSKLGGGVLRQLAWFDRTGKQLSRLNPPGMYNDVSLSPDGKWAAVQRIDPGTNGIWILETGRDVISRFTLGNNNEDDPAWSSDSKYLYFTSGATDGARRIARKPVSGGAEENIADAGERVLGEGIDVSSDGRNSVVVKGGEKGTDLWIVPLDSNPPFPLLKSEFTESQGRFSPDGRWVAYVSVESGRPEVYVRSFPDDMVKRQVSNQGGAQPRWNRDGKELFYIDPNRQLMSVKVRPNTSIEFENPIPLFLTQVSAMFFPNRYDVSADGQRFLVNSSTETNNESPLSVVTNWHAGLAAK